MHSNRILIISHDANLNGAPILLLRLMKLLKERGYTFNTILRHGGPLATDFKKLSEVFGYFKKPSRKGLIAKLNERLKGKEQLFDIDVYCKGVNLVLSNTVTNGEILKLIKENYAGPIITYVHELAMGEALYSTPAIIDMTIKKSDHFFVPSLAVKRHLQSVHSVSEKQISSLNYYIPVHGDEQCTEFFETAHERSGKFIVGGIGTIGWRKGTDIFLLVAAALFKKIPDANIQFVWMGGYSEDPEISRLNYDIEKLELQGKVVMLNASPDTSKFFHSLSILLLSSREDPYPLVVLEAAAKKVPTVCFENAGGAPEFVCPNAGTVVPYLDIEAMANILINCYEVRNVVDAYRIKAFEKVKHDHQNKEVIITQFNTVIAKFIASK